MSVRRVASKYGDVCSQGVPPCWLSNSISRPSTAHTAIDNNTSKLRIKCSILFPATRRMYFDGINFLHRPLDGNSRAFSSDSGWNANNRTKATFQTTTTPSSTASTAHTATIPRESTKTVHHEGLKSTARTTPPSKKHRSNGIFRSMVTNTGTNRHIRTMTYQIIRTHSLRTYP